MTELRPAELAGIASVIAEAGTAVAGSLRSRLLSGGRSNLTFLLEDEVSSWVMRTPPRVGRTPSAHDVAREFRAVRALGRTDVPVPPAVALCEDEAVLGAPFAVTGFVEGRSIQTRGQLDALSAADLDATIDALSQALAALHAVDHVAIGLAQFGRPDAYAERQLRRWTSQWQIVGAGASESVAALADRLAVRLGTRLPAQHETGIVHGDYRLDNTLVRVDPTGVEVTAIVDWELSTIGDPVADVANMCVYRDPAFDLIVGQPAAWTSSRMPSVEGLASSYEKAGGVALRDFDAQLALAYFKLAVIAAGIDHRYRAGATHGSGFSTAGDAVPLLLEGGLRHFASGD